MNPIESGKKLSLFGPEKEEDPDENTKTICIVIIVAGIILASYGLLCWTEDFPIEIGGGAVGCSINIIIGTNLMLCAAYYLFRVCRGEEELEEKSSEED